MAVSEYDRIDHLAVGPEGRLLLAMTEDRSYSEESDALLTEDFRRKLNGYLGAVRSGEVRRMADKAGVEGGGEVEIVLFSATKPTSTVLKMLETVNSNLGGEGISARWESLGVNENGPEVYERAMVDEVVGLLGADWKFALLWVSLVGDEGSGGIRVVRSDDSVDTVDLSELLRALLIEYKQVTCDQVAGAWLGGQVRIAPPDRYRVEFSWDSLPEWVPMPSTHDLRQELASYPRAVDQVPVWMRAQLG
ncbi:DUF6572 domain-containing protein [Nocardia sp. CC227C]|uniref:DUF6572 domain-containing protein n=1 Tax=Nocardia sp. CC227C TaxID=3044562 RepID=UPI00278C6099|nr:DUF6572 domain-containing protein [Nocardia sp. CC227C]